MPPVLNEENYGLSWPGKNQCLQKIQEPATGFLSPVPSESVNWDTARNLFVEGDNLDVMKLLASEYAGQIKMIYIDPPYNTGKRFTYQDNYTESLTDYRSRLPKTGFARKDASGRLHAQWMSMIYPRLAVARTLLRNDGVIFVSIDEHEVHHLKLIMNEIFGEAHFLACIAVVSNWKGRSDDRHYASAHNYLLVYEKEFFESKGVPLPETYWEHYSETDASGKYRLQGLRKRGSSAQQQDRPNLFFPLYVDPQTGKVAVSREKNFAEEVWPRLANGSPGRWRWNRETVESRLEELLGKPVGAKQRWDVFQKDYAETQGQPRRIKPKTVWIGSEFSNERGSLELKKLFGERIFDNPKPTPLIQYCLEQSVESDDLVLDFFAGSGTTAQAVLEMNRQDGGHRRFICIQTPEPCDKKSKAWQAGYQTLADIAKERIRRVLQQVSETSAGFRVFKHQVRE